MALPEAVAQVIRVMRKDTILIRSFCPLIAAQVSVYMTPCGVTCLDGSPEAIIDWVETHADAGRLRLIHYEWLRDENGRLLADLADLQSGEQLTDYLVEVGAAEQRPNHYMDVMHSLLTAKEPE